MPSDEWASFLISLTEKQQTRLISICRDRLADGDKFPPMLGELVVQIDNRTKSEVARAFLRWQINKPEGKAEIYVRNTCSYNLKRLPELRVESEFKRFLNHADHMVRTGQLPDPDKELKALPIHSSVSDTDRAVLGYKESGKAHRFTNRINSMIAEKKRGNGQ